MQIARPIVFKMSTHSTHPEFEIAPELRDTVERVRSGIEPVVVLTANGEPVAAIVSLATLQRLDRRDVAGRNDAALEQSDTAGMRPR